jgi:hypothetical protein
MMKEGFTFAKIWFYFLLGSLGVRGGKGLGLGLEAVLLFLGTALTSLLVLAAVGLGLLFDGLNTGVFGLKLVDSLNQVALVLVDGTLDLKVELVVQLLIDFLLVAILGKETTENAHSANPHELLGHTGVGRTLSLTQTGVTA